MITRFRITIQGRVQGVGCRPYIYRQATRAGLCGAVYNDSRGVVLELQGAEADISEFIAMLKKGKEGPGWPALMGITSIKAERVPVLESERQFAIRQSVTAGRAASQVTPDTATCDDCLREMWSQEDFRYRYPFINCTNCGPRYSIIESIPYDRPGTTMNAFDMCDKCGGQYTDPADRRFHAQPVACGECGPRVWLTDGKGNEIVSGSDEAIAEAGRILKDGKIAAIKGLGGFHLAVDAKNDSAVRKLRERKHRDHKPFAMMAANVEKIREYAQVAETAGALLESVESPVVLLKKRRPNTIAPSVAAGVDTFGFMVCYGPLHHLLFAEEGIDVLVMTSANLSDEPLICDNQEAIDKLGDIADAFLTHDRDIYRQVDDSIVHVVAGGQAVIRRSRGFVPRPILRDKPIKKHIFAAGADMKNTFCLAKDGQLIVSEHIGDLQDSRVYRHYVKSVEHMQNLFDVKPEIFVCDLHPSYISSRYALSLGGADTLQVQHHWAHIASVLAEYDYHDKVIGLVADGTGLGTDGAIWGCECMIASLAEFARIGHLSYFPLAGGDAASKESLRPIMGLLSCLSQETPYTREYAGLLETVETDPGRIKIIASQIEKNINTVNTSSMGRLFDAVAGMLKIGKYNRFDAELPMSLEAIAAPGIDGCYSVAVNENNGTMELDFRIMLRELIADTDSGIKTGVISAKFHNWAAAGLVEMAKIAKIKYGLNTVALSGGVFCNRYLANRAIALLKNCGFSVLYKRRVPANDGGISLGQAAIAAEKFAGG